MVYPSQKRNPPLGGFLFCDNALHKMNMHLHTFLNIADYFIKL